MEISLRKLILPVVVGCAAIVGLATPSSAATIDLNTLGTIINPSFETGTLSPWTQVQNGGGVYVPTSANYTAGSDGLPSPKLVPDGTHAAFVPSTGGAGHGILSQTLSTTWQSGNTYTLEVWIAMPNQVATPNASCASPPCANNFSNTTLYAQLFYDAGGGSLGQGGLTINSELNNSSISLLGSLGVWHLFQVSVTDNDAAVNGDHIVIQMGADMTSTAQPHQVDFDIVPTPIPGAAWLFGTALFGGLGLMRRKRRAPVTA